MTAAELAEAFAASLDRIAPAGPLGVALSGGSDSTALAVLAAGRARHAATVDHHLRPESGVEAAAAGRLASHLGYDHRILAWDGAAAKAGPGNLSAEARSARHRLLGDWARAQGLAAVLLGHTMDDQAETVVMRLARGSGVDGLAGMAERVEIAGTLWLRPLLGLRRADLRDFLTARGIAWAEDPTNDDRSYDRVRVRRAIGDLGLSVPGLAETAARLARQRRVLEADRDRLARAAARVGAFGEVIFDRAALEAAELDTSLALLADALCWVGGQPYRPRFDALLRVWEAQTDTTLAGCLILRRGGEITVTREPARAGGLRAGLWDGRWEVSQIAGVAPLGGDRPCLAATPALWHGETLLAAPLAGLNPPEHGFQARLAPPPARFRR